MRRIVLIVLAFALLFAGGCASDELQRNPEGEIFTSFLPPKTAEPGETFKVDANNAITLTNAQVLPAEEGARFLLITYNWENGSQSPQTIDQNVRLTAYQDSVRLQPDLTPVADTGKLAASVLEASTQYDIQQGFVLENDEPVVLNFTGNETIIFIDGRPQSSYAVQVTLSPDVLTEGREE